MREHSLKKRLLVLALLTVAVVWFVASAFIYFDARHEIDEVLDGHLAQEAALLASQATHELNELEVDQAPLLHKYSSRVAFQIWDATGILRLHSENAGFSPLSSRQSGFSDSKMGGYDWRVFSSMDESQSFLIHVAERLDEREEMARKIVSSLLTPLLASMPVLALLLWVAVARGLSPLARLAEEVDRRDPEALSPLDAEAAPHEVLPLIERLNQFFVRIDDTFQRERRFTADAAHELRTPVAVIKAQAQVARNATAEAERIHALDNAILGCDRATHLIEQLLTLARVDAPGAGMVESCDLQKIAAGEIAVIAPVALGKGVHIELHAQEEARLHGNPELLRILIRNLLDNAVRHTPHGTTVQVGIESAGKATSLSVNDDGPGISDQDLSKVSERFYRPVDTQASGSGLGLSIVRRIAEVHGAAVKFARAENGRGLSVTVTFGSN
jgi:two-component system sensor histidine kinase QseC